MEKPPSSHPIKSCFYSVFMYYIIKSDFNIIFYLMILSESAVYIIFRILCHLTLGYFGYFWYIWLLLYTWIAFTSAPNQICQNVFVKIQKNSSWKKRLQRFPYYPKLSRFIISLDSYFFMLNFFIVGSVF